ncbi:MAG: alpha/beta hydrolase [Dehalococcoidia bacterium]
MTDFVSIPPQDFSLLDRPEILSMMFYPRPDASPAPAGAEDLMIPVGEGVAVHGRWHPLAPDAPAVLFFHGNGEVVADYDGIAPVYHHYGLSLFVADYRGYGQSGGHPSFGAMLADALMVNHAFHETVDRAGGGPRFLMGRSLGGFSAIEIAARAPEGFAGLILESATAGARGWNRFSRSGDDPAAWDALLEGQQAKLQAVTLPLLSIHGEWDELIPVETAVEIQQRVGSAQKHLEVIPRAGHNDLLYRGPEQYFGAISAFVREHINA